MWTAAEYSVVKRCSRRIEAQDLKVAVVAADVAIQSVGCFGDSLAQRAIGRIDNIAHDGIVRREIRIDGAHGNGIEKSAGWIDRNSYQLLGEGGLNRSVSWDACSVCIEHVQLLVSGGIGGASEVIEKPAVRRSRYADKLR